MTPQQQNSTLIDANAAMSPSLMILPDEINRYSPILPPKNKQNDNNNKITNINNKTANNKEDNNNRNVQKKLKDMQKRSAQTLCNDHHKDKKKSKDQETHADDVKAKQKRHKTISTTTGRSRSISLYGVNSTMEQGSKEITIWLATDEPRYISGATNKTTCNDIIKAIIDDEIQNGNCAYINNNNNNKNNNNGGNRRATMKDCGNGAAAGAGAGADVVVGVDVGVASTASRDYSDYVLTECWRGIERSYDGRMPILPVWKAWSRVHNELRLTLKHRQEINEPPPMQMQKKKSGSLQSLCKFLGKIFTFGGKRSKQCAKTTEKAAERFLLTHKECIPDEFLFIILPENFQCPRHGKQHTPSHERPHTTEEAKRSKNRFLSERLCRLSEARGSLKRSKRRKSTKCPPRMHRSKSKEMAIDERHLRSISESNCEFVTAALDEPTEVDGNFLKRRKDMSRPTNVRTTLAQKTAEMNQLYEREHLLTRELTNKCELFKLQNELYMHADKQFELSVGQIQDNVEAYAKEIIKTEQELLELKQEIKHDISLINNLKRLTLTADVNECGIIMPPSPAIVKLKENMNKMTKVAQEQKRLQHEMQFVDNIYEFCDNNASMLV